MTVFPSQCSLKSDLFMGIDNLWGKKCVKLQCTGVQDAAEKRQGPVSHE